MGFVQSDTELKFSFNVINYSNHDKVEPPLPPPPKLPPTINSLPMEILIHVLKYLTASDLKLVALVCRRFLGACMYRRLSEKFMLNFMDSYNKDYNVKITQFANTTRIFPAISVNTGNFDVASPNFWFDYGFNVLEIYFRSGVLRKNDFAEIIRWTPNLRSIKIEANSTFKSWDIRETYDERIHSFKNCLHVSLAKNSYLNRKIFDYIVSKAPNLREIDLSFCLSGLGDLERNQLLDHFVFYLKGYGATVKLINMRQTLADDFFLNQLSEVSCLKLKSLAITFNGSSNNRKFGIIPLINAQKELEEFDLQESPAVEEMFMMEMCKVMKSLKVLNLRKCSHVTDVCLREVSKLESLEILDIASCELITETGIHDAFFNGKPKKKLRELHFGMLSSITEDLLTRFGKLFHHQLTTLDLGGSTNLGDDALQTIFYHFPFMRHLNLEGCWKISDFGITGKSKTQCFYSINGLRGLKSLRLQNCYKITDFALIDSFQFLELKEVFLARTHFTRDGIEAMVKNCPAIETLDFSEVVGVDDGVVEIITRNLQRLQTLKLNGNTKITATSFDHIYNNCKDIKYLYLRNCNPILKADKFADDLQLVRSLSKVYF